MATVEGRWLCSPLVVADVWAVGAGDSFTAGVTLALARGGAWDGTSLAGRNSRRRSGGDGIRARALPPGRCRGAGCRLHCDADLMRPLQNRVMPWGAIIADPARGLLMGNRGCLHDSAGQVRRQYRGRRWICCVTAFKGRGRALMQPGRYTELFFLDEAVALAAGHRPCAECRRASYDAFRDAWARAFGTRPGADAMDSALHESRFGPRPVVPVAGLPDGAMVGSPGAAALVLAGQALPFTPSGYGPPAALTKAPLLTPPVLVEVLRAGYVPEVHPSSRQRLTIG